MEGDKHVDRILQLSILGSRYTLSQDIMGAQKGLLSVHMDLGEEKA